MGWNCPHLSKQTCPTWPAAQTGTLGEVNMPPCVLVDPASDAYRGTNWKLVLQGRPTFLGTSTACPVVETGWRRPRELCSQVQDTRTWCQACLGSPLSSATGNTKNMGKSPRSFWGALFICKVREIVHAWGAQCPERLQPMGYVLRW